MDDSIEQTDAWPVMISIAVFFFGRSDEPFSTPIDPLEAFVSVCVLAEHIKHILVTIQLLDVVLILNLNCLFHLLDLRFQVWKIF